MSTFEEWNSSTALFDANMGDVGDYLNREILRPVVFRLLGDTSKSFLLDCGCGSGYLTAEIAKQTSKVVGTDFSPDFIALCRQKYSKFTNLSFQEYDVSSKSPFDSNEIDILLCKLVLQYVPKIDTFALESARTLKTDGQLVIIVEHPFCAHFPFGNLQPEKTNTKYKVLGNYFDKKPATRISLWGQVELTWYPKTIADYIKVFLDAGFSLSEMLEIPTEENGILVPRVLAMKFTKAILGR